MHIISRKRLKEFWERHPDARPALQSWLEDAKRAQWHAPTDIKQIYANASIIGNNRVVFNIKGNRYRLVVAVRYATAQYGGTIYIRFIGTHSEYNKIDAETI